MRIHEIRQMSARQFEQACHQTETSESTPTTITPIIETFVSSLNAGPAVYVPVVPDKHGLYGFCSDGVAQKITADGGSVAFGWSIWEWPGLLLTAEFHAVWRDEAGDLNDITPKPGGEDRILFVQDPSYDENFNFDERPRNRRMCAYCGPNRESALKTIRAKLTGGQLRYEEKRAAKANLSLDDWLKRKIPADALAEAVDEVITACDEFDEHFDSLGVAGIIEPDESFVRLAKRRYLALERAKALAQSRLG